MRIFLASLMVLFMAAEAHAQCCDQQPALDVGKGSGALMFDMGGLFSSAPTNFEGIGVGARYGLANKMLLRAALGIDSSSSETDPEGADTTENKTSSFAIEGGVDLILFRRDNVYIYTGGILQVGISSLDPHGKDNETDGTSLTLAGVVGANWFFTQNVSAGAEYRLGIMRSTSETKTVKTTDFTFGTGSAAFQLGFWF